MEWLLALCLAALTLALCFKPLRLAEVAALSWMAERLARFRPPELSELADRPVAFGHKMLWLAVRADSPAQVAAALYIQNIAYANWRTGVASAYDHGMRTGSVFLSPRVDGWVLVAGGLPYPGGTAGDKPLLDLLKNLSHRFGEVQYFGTHLAARWHAWAKWINGAPVRAFAYRGDEREAFWNIGTPTQQERDLGLGLGPAAADDATAPEEADVMRLAAAWSVDPTQLETRGLPRATGMYAEILGAR